MHRFPFLCSVIIPWKLGIDHYGNIYTTEMGKCFLSNFTLERFDLLFYWLSRLKKVMGRMPVAWMKLRHVISVAITLWMTKKIEKIFMPLFANHYLIQQKNSLCHWYMNMLFIYSFIFLLVLLIHVNKNMNINFYVRATGFCQWYEKLLNWKIIKYSV